MLWVAGSYGGQPVDLGPAGVLPAAPSDGGSSFLISMLPPSRSSPGTFLTSAAARGTSSPACGVANAPSTATSGRRQAGVDAAGNGYLGASSWEGPLVFGSLGTYLAPSPQQDIEELLWAFLASFGKTNFSTGR